MEFSMENRFSFYKKCKNGCAYWAYFKVSLNDYDESGHCLLTENDKNFLTQNVKSVKMTCF